MGSLSDPFKGRRQYRRLKGTIPRRKKIKIIRLGGGGGPRRIWRIREFPKFHLLKIASSPLALWKKIKNAYVNMMLKFAGNFTPLNNNGDVFEGMRISNAPPPMQVACNSREEFETKLVYEIFKSLMASNELGYHNHMEGNA